MSNDDACTLAWKFVRQRQLPVVDIESVRFFPAGSLPPQVRDIWVVVFEKRLPADVLIEFPAEIIVDVDCASGLVSISEGL